MLIFIKKFSYKFKARFKRICDLLPVNRKKIVFDNFSGKGFGGNPKYISEYLNEHTKIKSVWLTADSTNFPDYVHTVKCHSLLAYYHASTAAMRITNIRNSPLPPKKKDQLHLQTWHGPYSYKMVEKEVEDQLSENYVEKAKYDGLITDAILVSDKLQLDLFQASFWLNDHVEYLCFGLPRTDILIKKSVDQQYVMKLRENLGIRYNELLVLYAPTFRDDHSLNGYIRDFSVIENELTLKFRKNVKLCVRLHPNARDLYPLLQYPNSILNLTDYTDSQDITLAADILVTDYSSLMFDFALLKKPVFVAAIDYVEYIRNRRLRDDYKVMPFPLAYSMEELKNAVSSFDQTEYNRSVEKYFNKNNYYNKGNSIEQICEWIEGKLEK